MSTAGHRPNTSSLTRAAGAYPKYISRRGYGELLKFIILFLLLLLLLFFFFIRTTATLSDLRAFIWSETRNEFVLLSDTHVV